MKELAKPAKVEWLEQLKGKGPQVAKFCVSGGTFGAADIWGLWPTIAAAGNDRAASGCEGIWPDTVKGKRMGKSGFRKYTSLKTRPEPPSTYTISSVGKYTLAPILLLYELIPSIEIRMAHADAAMKS